MRTHHFLLFASGIILLMLGCGQASEPHAGRKEDSSGMMDLERAEASPAGEAAPAADTPSDVKTALSSSAAAHVDTARRFILTGDLRFRTDDVVKSTFAIEALIARQGGFVASTHLATEIHQRWITPISADSSLETTKYSVVNRLTVRVPSDQLDTTLKSLIAHVDFLDHRTLSATDVRIALLRDKLTRRRLARHTDRLTDAIDEKGQKLKETVTAEDRLIDRQAQADEAALNTLELEDRIAYSSLTLDIYQRENIRREMLVNEQNIEAYEPGFFSKAGEALHDGWELLQDIALALIRSWSVVLLVIAAFALYRLNFRRPK